jgi:hypothetical protein
MLCFLCANTEARKKVWKIPASFFRLVAEGLAVVFFFNYVGEFEAARQFEVFFPINSLRISI